MADTSSLSCPVCGRDVTPGAEPRPEAFPFCSARCRLRDLGAWLDGRHVIAGRPLDPDEAVIEPPG